MQVVVAAGGDNVLLAWGDGRIQLLDAQGLEVLKEFTPQGEKPAKVCQRLAGGSVVCRAFSQQKSIHFGLARRNNG